MERNINSLLNYSIEATDGVIGEVKEFYFDDQTCDIRYLIVKTGGWLSGREVLISPAALVKGDWQNGLFPVNHTKKQISDSPDIDTHKPVSRQLEIALYDHYAWEGYWVSGFYPGGYLGVSMPFPVLDNKALTEADKNNETSDDDLHLRSTERITGYHIHAKDGEVGHVKDFIIDDQTWQILYFVVDTHNWLGGEKVLIAVRHIKKLEWGNSNIFVDITMAAVKNSRFFEESEFSTREKDNTIKVTLPLIPNEIH
jgi:sporulation protein YlmC with PRC-barrel domain